MAGSRYDGDIVALANEQASLLRAGLFSQLDIEHVIEEIEDDRRHSRSGMAACGHGVARFESWVTSRNLVTEPK